jgi:uncharacterized protein YecE (DUF72 family)
MNSIFVILAVGDYRMPVAGKSVVRIGIAGWAMPATLSDKSPEAQSHLEQYSRYFNAVEINSSFYRPHRRNSYQRWGASVPPSFRFAVKMPKLITHERRLSGCAGELSAFLHGVAGLGEKLGVLLVQLPASVVFDEKVTRAFLELLSGQTTAKIVCEPRSPSWFVSAAEDLFARFGVTRVSAHPVPWHCPGKALQEGDFAYLRLHGAPRIYYSSYSPEFLNGICSQIAGDAQGETWCIFDNTAEGAAWPNARSLLESVSNHCD